MSATRDARIKRIYDEPARDDGYRVLVDRLWPRGVTKSAAKLDAWARELAPSPMLRTWFGHDPRKMAEFRRRYRRELRSNAAAMTAIAALHARRRVTLLYAAKDPRINHARVLQELVAAAISK